jgi:hypothetical protein
MPNNAYQNYTHNQNQMVGYSFSSNFLGVNESSQNEQLLPEKYIP